MLALIAPRVYRCGMRVRATFLLAFFLAQIMPTTLAAGAPVVVLSAAQEVHCAAAVDALAATSATESEPTLPSHGECQSGCDVCPACVVGINTIVALPVTIPHDLLATPIPRLLLTSFHELLLRPPINS